MAIVNLILLIGVVLAKVVGFGATFRPSAYRLLISLRVYLAYLLAVDLTQYITIHRFGYLSPQYASIYWTTDISTVVFGYFVLVRLVELAFSESPVRLPGIRVGAMLLFSGVATLTAYFVVRSYSSFSLPWFSIAIEENIAFLGMLLTLALWGGMNLLRVPGVRFRRVVLAFGVLYSSGAVIYALMDLFPNFVKLLSFAPPVTSLLSLSLLAYTLVTPEGAPLPARKPSTRLDADDAPPVAAIREVL